MSGTLNGLMTQYATAVKLKGNTIVTLRRTNSTGGPNPLPIPPVCENPQVSALTGVGSTTISIGASAANGALVAGDKMTIAGVTYTVSAQVNSTAANATSPGFHNVPVTPAVASPIPAGTPISFTFSLDQSIYVTVGSYAQGLIDGTLIQSSDLMFTVATWNLLTGAPIPAPNQSDQIIYNGVQFAIENITPKIALGNVIGYFIQARA